MAEKEKNSKEVKQTEFQKKILNLLVEQGFTNPVSSKVAIMTHNNNLMASVNYDCMSTSITFPKKDVTEQEVLDAGFKWWPTWHYYG